MPLEVTIKDVLSQTVKKNELVIGKEKTEQIHGRQKVHEGLLGKATAS